MKKLLYIIANPNPKETSFSRQMGDFCLELYRKNNPDDEIVVKDLYKDGVFMLDTSYMAAHSKIVAGKESMLTAEEKMSLAKVTATVDEFIAFDRYVLASPMWNFGIPPLLKAYIDNVLIAGKTFKYTAEGPRGLLSNLGKKVLFVQASGGVYSQGDAARFNHCSAYVKDIFALMGLNDFAVINVEGVAIPGLMERAVAAARSQAEHLMMNF